jgi:hypothetical protein
MVMTEQEAVYKNLDGVFNKTAVEEEPNSLWDHGRKQERQKCYRPEHV